MGTKRWIWAFLGLFSLGLRLLAGQFPEATDQIYSRAIFPLIRKGFDFSLGYLPFPSVYLVAGSALVLLLIFIRRLLHLANRKQRIRYSLSALANGMGALVFFFLLLWGFNYQRTPLIQQLGMQPQALNVQQVKDELERTQQLAAYDRGRISKDTLPITESMDYDELESTVRTAVQRQVKLLGLGSGGRPRTKPFPPAGFMRRLGILGIYFPFTGESYLDPSMHLLEKPFTVAHEMAHSYGVTDEGEANFLAWVICIYAEDPILRYSGHLRLLRYQLRDYYSMDPEGAVLWMDQLPRGIIQDLISIQKSNEVYTPYFLELSRASNDLFLKSQGVKAGINSYQQLPMLVFAWRLRTNRGG